MARVALSHADLCRLVEQYLGPLRPSVRAGGWPAVYLANAAANRYVEVTPLPNPPRLLIVGGLIDDGSMLFSGEFSGVFHIEQGLDPGSAVILIALSDMARLRVTILPSRWITATVESTHRPRAP